MKRATREWLSQRFPSVQANEAVKEIHATLARKDAQIRDLKARLKAVAKAPVSMVVYTAADNDAADLAFRAINLKNKNWRKP